MTHPDYERDIDRFKGQQALAALQSCETVADLAKLVGEITPEERVLLDRNSPDKHPPTPEEQATLGPNFLANVIAAGIRRNKRQAAIETQGGAIITDLASKREQK